MKARSATVALAIVSVIVSPVACNIFVSVDRCSSSADCPTNFHCDPEFAFCAHDGPSEEAGPDASPDVGFDIQVVEAAPTVDAPIDVVDAGPCNLTAPFGAITAVQGLEGLEVGSARLKPDEKTVYFSAYNGCQVESCIDLFLAQRTSPSTAFTDPHLIAGVNTPTTSEYWPTLTADGTVMFLESGRSLEKVNGSYFEEGSRIWTTKRNGSVDQFEEPFIEDIFKVDASILEASPYLHPSGNTLYFASNGRGGKGALDIFVANLDGAGSASSITNVDAINSATSENQPTITLNERTLYFSRESAIHDIMVSHRPDTVSTFGAPTPVTELNGYDQWPAWISDDECRLYFISNRPHPLDDAGTSKYRLWVAEHPK